MNGVMSTILNKKQLGAIGENLVQTKLMQLGLNVVNANIIRPDYEAIDLICSLPGSKNAACIQVKTCRDSNFPIGMTLGKCTEDYLKEKIKGPWVFVHVSGEGVKMEFRYYILTREEMIALSSESNFWYVNRWKTTYRSKPVNLKNACGLELKWLMGKGEEDNYKHEAFINPIKVSAENRWDKILNELDNKEGINYILKEFTGVVNVPEEEKKDVLQKQFTVLAKKILYGGYFLINGIRRITLQDIEFYYHEEKENGLKDPAMYHTSDHEKNEALLYFALGTFNCHLSGIDITFENPEEEYRASFLIRGYKVESFVDGCWKEEKKHEKRSTFLYEDLLKGMQLNNPLTIEWINEKNNTDYAEVGTSCRLNVPAYKKDENNYYMKDSDKNYIKDEISVVQYRNLSTALQSEYFAVSGKYYKKCNRQWRFYRK